MRHVIWVRFTRKPVTCVSFRKMVPSSPMKNWPNIWQPIRKDFQRLGAAGSARWARGDLDSLRDGGWIAVLFSVGSCGLRAWNDGFLFVGSAVFCWFLVDYFLQIWKFKSFVRMMTLQHGRKVINIHPTTGVSIIMTLCFYARNAAKESCM